MTPSFAAILSLAALMAGSGLLATGLWRARRARMTATPADTAAADAALPAAEATAADLLSDRLARIETALEGHGLRLEEALGAMKEELAAIRGDLEWLAGERMIEEAIALARTGTASEEIATETGLSADAIRTISAFRHH
jgi:hypothetical protein